MKNFVIFFIVGIITAIGYFLLNNNRASLPIIQSLKPKTQFSIEQPPKDSIKGTIQSLSGLVKWESRVATESVELIKEIPIQQGENILTGDNGKVAIDFEKKVAINAEPQTSIAVIQTLPVNFVFSQASGSAEYKKLDQIPVSVRSFHLIITIDGEIKLSVDNQTGLITVEVKKGIAKLGFNDLQYISQVVEVKAGQIYVFDDTNREGETKD